jgi:hypothetical protein
MSLKKTSFSVIRNIVGETIAQKIAESYLERKKIFNPESAENAYLKKFPLSQIVPANKLLLELFNVYYGVKTADQISPAIGTPCAYAYVPYYHGKTKLLMFNFFNRNYGIRDPLLIRISLLNGATVYSVKQSIFAPDAVYLEDFIENDNEDVCQYGAAVVEVFHPHIKTPGDQFRFFVIYRDLEKGKISGVHSVQFNKEALPQRKLKTGYRAYTPPQTYAHYFDLTEPRLPLVPDTKQNGKLLSHASVEHPYYTMGYCCLEDDESAPSGIWHDNMENNTVNVRSKKHMSEATSPCMAAFYVPDFRRNAPIALISVSEIGFRPERLAIRSFYETGEFIAERFVEVQSDNDSIDLANVFFEDSIEGSTFFIVSFGRTINEFEVEPPCYLNLYYRCGKGFADQVHSHPTHTYGFQQALHPTPKPYRMRKMAPLLKEEGLRFVYSIVTVNGTNKFSDETVTLRIFTDMETEHVYSHYPLLNNGVAVIHGDALMEEIGSHIERSAVIWFEHQTTNFNGTWFAIDKNTGHVGIDHFTGA